MRRTLNIKLLLIVCVAAAAIGGGLFALNRLQRQRGARSLLKQADLAEKKGDREAAEAALSRYIALRPDDADARSRFGLMLGDQADDEAARRRGLLVLEQALRVDPSRRDVRRKVVDLAMGLKRPKEAREHIETLRKDAPKDGELEALLGECEEADGHYAEAEALYAQANEHAPHRVATYPRRAALLRSRLSRAAEADRVMDARDLTPGNAGIVGANPDSAEAHLARARYRRAHGLPGAASDVADARRLAPESPEVLIMVAESALQGRQIDEARSALEKARTLAPKDERVYRVQAAAEMQAGRPSAAVETLTRGIEALGGPDSPKSMELRWLRAGALVQAGKADEARAELGDFRRRGNVAPAPLDYLEGQILAGLKRWDDAVRVLERVRAQAILAPNQSGLVTLADALLTRCYEGMGRFDRQLEAARRALSNDPDSTSARLAEASALAALGRIDEALDAYRRLAADEPTASAEAARLSVLRDARRPASERDPDAVDRAVAEAASALPDSVDAAILGADALLLRGRAEAARDRIRDALKRTPDRPELWIALAQIAAREGGPDAALKALDEADAKLGPRADLRLARADAIVRRGGPSAGPSLKELADRIDEVPGADRDRLQDGLADAFARIGDLAGAGKLWSGLSDWHPDDLRLAQILFDLAMVPGDRPGRADEIRRAIERFRKIEGEGGALWRFAEANRLLDDSKAGDRARHDEARRLLAEVAKIRPDWPPASRVAGILAEREGDVDGAIAAYLKAIEQGERRPEVIRRATTLLNQKRRYGEAEEVLRKLVPADGAAGSLGRMAAEQSLQVRDQQRALDLARRAVPEDSKDPSDHLWLGQILAGAGRAAEAEAEYRKAIALDGTRPEAWMALVQFLIRSGPRPRAEAAATEAGPKLAASAPLALALIETTVGHTEAAEAIYVKELARKPDDPALLRTAAGFYMATGRASKAEPHLRKALQLAEATDPKSAPADRRSLAMVLSGLGKSGEAMSLIEANLASGASEEDGRLRALLLASRPGRGAEAIAAFDDLARLRPPAAGERFYLALLLIGNGEWTRARDVLNGLLAKDGENPQYLASLVEALIGEGRPAEADAPAAKLAQVAPKALVTHATRARLLKAQGKPVEAVAILEAYAATDGADPLAVATLVEAITPSAAEPLFRLAAADPKRPLAALDLASYLGRRGRGKDAVDVCERARATCPPQAVTHACLVALNAGHAGPDLARRVEPWFREAIRKDPSNLALQFDLTNLLDLEQNYSEMELALRRLVELDPTKSGPLHNLGWLLAVRGENKGEALRLVDRAIALEGPIPDYRDTRALAFLAGGRPEQAVRELEAVASARPTAEVLFHLARARRAAGDRTAAAEALRRAKAKGLDEPSLHALERPSLRQLRADLEGR